jgi:hypothetical protein
MLIVRNKKQLFVIPVSRCQIPCLGVVCGMILGECDSVPVICILLDTDSYITNCIYIIAVNLVYIVFMEV